MRLLVTGCGRSGTQYLARLLSALGLRGGHERVYREDLHPKAPPSPEEIEARWALDCGRDFEVSWMAAPFLDRLPHDVVVWHQLREPFKVVRCWASNKLLSNANHSTLLVHEAFPECGEGSDLARAVSYVVCWNELAAERGARSPHYFRYPVESLTAEHLCWLLDRIGWKLSLDRIEEVMGQVEVGIGGCSHPHEEITWDQIRRTPDGGELANMSRRHGYGVRG